MKLQSLLEFYFNCIEGFFIPDNSTSIESVKEKINEFYESF